MQKIAYQVDTPKVKYLMCKKGLTGSWLARCWRCHPSTVSRIIRGQIKDQEWMNKLAQALEVELGEIRTQDQGLTQNPTAQKIGIGQLP